ncbi:hypothetical protein ACWDZ6_21215 [Streptomyces sp. NPDC002926]
MLRQTVAAGRSDDSGARGWTTTADGAVEKACFLPDGLVVGAVSLGAL